MCDSIKLLARLFTPKNLAESLGSDYMHDSKRDSFGDSVLMRLCKKTMRIGMLMVLSHQFYIKIKSYKDDAIT